MRWLNRLALRVLRPRGTEHRNGILLIAYRDGVPGDMMFQHGGTIDTGKMTVRFSPNIRSIEVDVEAVA